MIINNRVISNQELPYIIAELSANHNGSIERAFESILAAKEAGADAVKIQTYTADTMTIDCGTADFQVNGGLWDGYKLYDLYKEAQTPYEWHKPLFDYAREIGITIFSTPFDETAVDLLEEIGAPAYKIASFEMIDLELIKYVANTKKPMIISTGMANLEEISEAVEVARNNGCNDLALLHCISSYPAPIEQSNLRTIADLSEKFDILTGLSDHTMGTVVSTVSVALGACIIEKHFTLSRADKGPDSEFSLEPHELKKLCKDTKEAWRSLGKAGYERKRAEEGSSKHRRSLYFVKDISDGDVITKDHIRRIRPGYGLPPKFEKKIIGMTVKKDIKSGTATSWNLISK